MDSGQQYYLPTLYYQCNCYGHLGARTNILCLWPKRIMAIGCFGYKTNGQVACERIILTVTSSVAYGYVLSTVTIFQVFGILNCCGLWPQRTLAPYRPLIASL